MAKATRDVVVLLPGITGSILEKDGKAVWAGSLGAMLRALVSRGGSLRDLALTDDDPDVDDLGDGVRATAIMPDLHMIPGLWKIDGYGKVAAQLVKTFALKPGENFFEFAYDWRRDNRVAARRLQREARAWLAAWRQRSGAVDAKLVLVAHSMGGLVARHYLEVLGGWKDTRALITFGTPYRGSLNALDFIANGFSKGIGPFKLDLSEMLRSLTSVYQLLPVYPCVDLGDGRLVRVPETDAIPNLDPHRAIDAHGFHRAIHEAQERNAREEAYRANGYRVRPVVGIRQPTLQSARLRRDGLEMLRHHFGRDDAGDGTVPRVSAIPYELSEDAPAMYAAQRHASLQNFDPVLAQVEGVITGHGIDLKKYRLVVPVELGLEVDDAYLEGEPVAIAVQPSQGRPRLKATVVRAETSEPVTSASLRAASDGVQRVEIPPLPAGFYRLTVGGGANVSPVTDVFEVVGESLLAPDGVAVGWERPPTAEERITVEPTRRTRSRARSSGAGRYEYRGRPAPGPSPTPPPRTAKKASKKAAKRGPGAPGGRPPEGTTIERHPSITTDRELRPGDSVTLTVDLLLEDLDRETESAGVRIGGLAADWSSIPVHVTVMSTDLVFDGRPDVAAGEIEVRRDGASKPFQVACSLKPEAEGRDAAEVVATFAYEGRFSGFARRTLPVAAESSIDATSREGRSRGRRPKERPAERPQGTLAVEVGAAAPEVTVKIFQIERGGGGVFLWSIHPREEFDGLPAKLHGEIDLGATPAQYARDLFAHCAELEPGRHMAAMEGIGETLWDKAPECFRQAYWALRDRYGPGFAIQFVSDDPHVPWELMRPYREGETAPILALAHPVARWIARYEGEIRNRLPGGRIVTIAPRYQGAQALPQAQVESKRLVDRFQARSVPGTLDDVTGVLWNGLADETVGIVHFAGHGQFGEALADQSAILLEDGPLTVLEVGNQRTKLGELHRTVVIFSACEVGAIGAVLGEIGGWAQAFTRRKFGGFVAPLWAVYDDDAATVVTELLDAVWTERRPFGEALRDIRARHGEDSPTFFSYLFYGDVLARVEA